MEENPKEIRYIDLKKVCEYYFGKLKAINQLKVSNDL